MPNWRRKRVETDGYLKKYLSGLVCATAFVSNGRHNDLAQYCHYNLLWRAGRNRPNRDHALIRADRSYVNDTKAYVSLYKRGNF
jgi:hypothetical protein